MATTTIKEAMAAFLLQLDADGRSPHTLSQYGRHVRRFVAWVGDAKPVAEVRPDDLARYLVSPVARGEARSNKPTTVNMVRTSLRMLFAFTHGTGLTPTNPARVLRLALCEGPQPRGLSEPEVRRLFDALTVAQGFFARRDHMLIAVMLRSGLRLGSALGLDSDDVDLDDGVLLVRRSKGGRQDRVFLSAELRDHLRGYLAERPEGPLFTSSTGKRLGVRGAETRILMWFATARVRETATAHWLRHTFAMRLYGQTRDVGLVQRALCHRSIASTLAYARADDRAVRAAILEQMG